MQFLHKSNNSCGQVKHKQISVNVLMLNNIKKMPSLRQRVSTYFRQLSFIREDRYTSRNLNDGSFITKYLESGDGIVKGPEVFSGKDPSCLPDLPLDSYNFENSSLQGACTGPDDGFLGKITFNIKSGSISLLISLCVF